MHSNITFSKTKPVFGCYLVSPANRELGSLALSECMTGLTMYLTLDEARDLHAKLGNSIAEAEADSGLALAEALAAELDETPCPAHGADAVVAGIVAKVGNA